VRATLHPKLIAGRIRSGAFWSDDSHGHNGIFKVLGPNGAELTIMASDGLECPDKSLGWEHVSVSLRNRCPNWPEMSFVKSLFWEPEETVVQFHPPKSTYISNHAYCLHLWRDSRNGHALPPAVAVGYKEAGEITGPEHAAKIMRDLGLS
jgi:hypothetical protein